MKNATFPLFLMFIMSFTSFRWVVGERNQETKRADALVSTVHSLTGELAEMTEMKQKADAYAERCYTGYIMLGGKRD